MPLWLFSLYYHSTVQFDTAVRSDDAWELSLHRPKKHILEWELAIMSSYQVVLEVAT